VFPLKYNTANQTVPLGYFVDNTTGDAEQTALTIANTDIKLWKNGATTLVNKNSGGASHMSTGVYYCTFDNIDTNIYGPLEAYIHKSGSLVVHKIFVVVDLNAYNALMTSTSGSVRSNITQINSDLQSILDLKDFADFGYDPSTHKVEEVKLVDSVSGALGVSTVSSAIWTAASRTLTSGTLSVNTSEIVNGVWNELTSSHTTSGSMGKKLSDSITTNSPTVNDIWTAPSRTLTSGSASLTANEIWNSPTRTLTSGSATLTAIDVRTEMDNNSTKLANLNATISSRMASGSAVVVSTNNDKTGYALSVAPPTTSQIWDATTRTLTSGSATLTAAQIWTSPSRTLTSGSASSLTANDIWTSPVRTLTSGTLSVNTAEIVNAVWNEQTSLHITSGSAGKRLIDAGSAGVPPTVDEIWAAPSRTLTSGSATLTVNDIWTAPSRTLTSGSASSLTAVDIRTEMDNNSTKLANLNATITSRMASGSTVVVSTNNDKTGYSLTGGVTVTTNNDKTGYSLSGTIPSANDISNTVWTAINRTLTSGSAILTAADIWNSPTRTLTSGSASTAPTVNEIWSAASRTLTSGSATLTANDIWTAPTRTLTSGSASTAPTVNEIWSAASRTLTSGSLNTTEIANAIWAAANRTLTSGSASITAADVWAYVSRTLTSGSLNFTVSEVANAVWNELILNHLGAGTVGSALNSAGSSGDPWGTQLPGVYGVGTAGKILGDRIDAAITSRATAESTSSLSGTLSSIKINTDLIPNLNDYSGHGE
jgi:hypothetical protein